MATLAAALPGLCFAALCAGLYVALAAWFDPIPRRVILVHTSLVALVLGPHLFLGRTLLPVSSLRGCSVFGEVAADTSAKENPLHHDLLMQHLPTTSVVRDAWARRELPLRDDTVAGGVPLWADPQAQVGQPLMLLSLLFPAERALVVVAALRLLLALTFTFLVLQLELGSAQGALAGSVAFGMGGFTQLWLGWPLGSSAAWMPAVLYGLCRIQRRFGRRDAVMLVAATYGISTAGHPETVVYAFVFVLAYGVLRSACTSAATRVGVVFAMITSLAVGATLTAPLNIPSVRAIAVSERSLVLAFEEELRVGRSELREARPARLASVIAPDARGNNRFGYYWGESNINEDGCGYAGSVALFFALLVLASRRWDRAVAFHVASLVVCLLVISGVGPFGWIVSHAPVLKTSATAGHRLLLLVNWIVAWLAARGVAAAEEGAAGRLRTLATATMLASSIAAAYWLASPPLSVTAAVSSRRTTMLVVQLSAVVIAAITSAVRSRVVAGRIIVAALAVELLIAHVPANPASSATVPEAPTLLATLREKAEGWRVQASPSALRANLASLYGIRQIESYNPIVPASWFAIAVAIPNAVEQNPGPDAEAWLDVLGVRYRALPRADVQATGRLALDDGRTAVIERPTVLPPFRFAEEVSVAPAGSLVELLFLPADQSMKTVARRAAAKGDGMVAWLLENPPRAGQTYVADDGFWSAEWRPVDGDVIELRERSPARLSFAVRSQGPRLLATAEIDDGGWTARVDGRAIASEKVNGAFVGVKIPAGATCVELRYVPPGLTSGVAVGLAAFVSFLALLMTWPRLYRARDVQRVRP